MAAFRGDAASFSSMFNTPTDQLPACNVTLPLAEAEGTFVYTPGQTRYDWRCWFLTPGYHVAPDCPRANYRPGDWRFALQAAVDGTCRMPPSEPAAAAEAWLALHGSDRGRSPDKPLTVLMLGLSFMGQEFEALACMHKNAITGGSVACSVPKRDTAIRVPVMDIIRNNRTVLKEKTVKSEHDYWLPTIHSGKRYRPRGPDGTTHCEPGNALLEFGSRMRVCWRYLFNLKKTLAQWKERSPKDRKEPMKRSAFCGGLDVKDVDVILSLIPADEIKSKWFQMVGLDASRGEALPRVIYVGDTFRFLQPQLRQAYCCQPELRRAKLAEPSPKDFKGQATSCTKSDVHMAQPDAGV